MVISLENQSGDEAELLVLAKEHGVKRIGSGSSDRQFTPAEAINLINAYAPIAKAASLPESLYYLLE